MNIDEARKLKAEAEEVINKTLLDFYYLTGLSIDSLDVTIHRHETVCGSRHTTLDVKINVGL